MLRSTQERDKVFGRPQIQKSDTWDNTIREWKAGNITAVEAMGREGLSNATFYRMVKRYT